MVIDTHAHVGFEKDNIENRPGCADVWFGTSMFNSILFGPVKKKLGMTAEDARNRVVPNFTLEYLIESMDDGGVTHACIVGMDVTTVTTYMGRWKDKGAEWKVPNEYVAKCCDKYPDRLIGVAGIDPFKEQATRDLERAVNDLHLTGGVKIFTPAGFAPNDKKLCYPLYEKCLDLNIPVLFHTGPSSRPGTRVSYNGVAITNPVLIDEVAMDFPELRIHMLHCGSWMYPREALCVVSKNPNVYTDIDIANPDLWAFGGPIFPRGEDFFKWCQYYIPDRLMYATDYPFGYPHRNAIEKISSYDLSADFRKKIFEENAKRFYRIG